MSAQLIVVVVASIAAVASLMQCGTCRSRCSPQEGVVARPTASASSRSAGGRRKGSERCNDGMIFIAGDSGRDTAPNEFCIDKREVSVSEYALCVKNGPCRAPLKAGSEDTMLYGLCNWGLSQVGDHPINCISYYEASAYCAWKGDRLPTSREWWWAASGRGENRKYPWGEQTPTVADACWSPRFGDDRMNRKRSCVIAAHPRDTTRDGVLDMAGNVSEWTSTKTSDNTRVARGGRFRSREAVQLEVALGSDEIVTSKYAGHGFRCAANVSKTVE